MKPANYAPIYACVYAQLAEVARSHGYALAAHGSLAADFDLVCIPWVPGVSDPQSVVDEITSRFAIKQVGAPERKKHGRIAYAISFEFGECRLDLSFMPTEAAQDQGEVQRLREALEEIADPIKFMRARLEDGEQLNGVYAIQMAESGSYLREIAKRAIAASTGQEVKP